MSFPSKRTVSIWAVEALVVFTLAALPGCGRSGPKTVSVSGKVTYKGKPVSKGNVVFQPVDLPKGRPFRPSRGELREDGSYRMSTFSRDDGPMPGKYRVIIRSLVSGPTPENPAAPYIWAVPRRYTDTKTTPLEATIPEDASGGMVFDFDLTDQ